MTNARAPIVTAVASARASGNEPDERTGPSATKRWTPALGAAVPPPNTSERPARVAPAASWVGDGKPPSWRSVPVAVSSAKMPPTEVPEPSRPPAMTSWSAAAPLRTTSRLIGAASSQGSSPASMAGVPAAAKLVAGDVPVRAPSEPSPWWGRALFLAAVRTGSAAGRPKPTPAATYTTMAMAARQAMSLARRALREENSRWWRGPVTA